MTSSNELQNKVAFVQGGSRGIGAAIVKRLALDGASVAFTYVSSDAQAELLVRDIVTSGGKAIAIKADSTDPEAIRRAVREAVQQLGRLDIVVNNAGALIWEHIENLTLEHWERTINTNVRSAFIASQEAAIHMQDGGRIIHIGSTNAERVPFAGGSIYSMSKAALVGLTKGLARDLGPRAITVNNIQPGPVDTDMNPADIDAAAPVKAIGALGRYGTPDEIAAFVAFIAGPQAGYITGASLMIDGGFSI